MFSKSSDPNLTYWISAAADRIVEEAGVMDLTVEDDTEEVSIAEVCKTETVTANENDEESTIGS